MINKIADSAAQAMAGVRDGATVLIGGFGTAGIPGELIDALGLRGFRVGSAWVSTKHANFIQADEGGRAADVVAVIDEVRARVAAAHGIVLRSEVRLAGFPGGSEQNPGVSWGDAAGEASA